MKKHFEISTSRQFVGASYSHKTAWYLVHITTMIHRSIHSCIHIIHPASMIFSNPASVGEFEDNTFNSLVHRESDGINKETKPV